MENEQRHPGEQRVVEAPEDFSDIEEFLDGETPWRSRERSRLFPDRPPGVEYGVLLGDSNDATANEEAEAGGVVRCRDFSEVRQRARSKPGRVKAVWIPGSDFGIPWQLLPSVEYHDRATMKKAFFQSIKSQGFMGVGFIVGAIYFKFPILILLGIFQLMTVFNLLLSWLTFPGNLTPKEVRWRGVDVTLFQKWLNIRGTNFRPLVGFLLVLIGVFLVQVYKSTQPDVFGKFFLPAFEGAALSKQEVLNGEWWRVLTTGVVHGPIIHIWFNAYALYSLGRLLTSLSNISILTIVFLLSVIGGSLASLYFKDLDSLPSVGASGGILGILGYLCFICLRFRKTIPFEFTNMLIRNVLLISLIGVLGAGFIDNAAHAGGLLTGVAAGAIIGPHRKDWWNARPNVIHHALALMSAAVLAWTVYKAVVEIW